MTGAAAWHLVRTVALLCSACGGGFGDDDDDGGGSGGGSGNEPTQPVSVLTYNVYLGTAIGDLLTADTMDELAARVAAAKATFDANDFTMRADAIAARIAEEQPTLIGLQEVITLYVQPAGDRMTGGSTPADQLVIDFEQVLLAALADRGLDYRAVVRSESSDVEVPSATGEDFRLIDHNLILVRGDIPVGDIDGRRFAARLPIPMPDRKSVNEVERGFVSAVVTLDGQPTVFVSTHLEVAPYEEVQLAQTVELLAWLETRGEPVILVGDFNSEGDPAQSTGTYDLIEEAGYDDAWKLAAAPSDRGYTCCQSKDLRNETSALSQRLDVIWLKDDPLAAISSDTHLVGEDPTDKTRSGLWPSDHAGVVARFTP